MNAGMVIVGAGECGVRAAMALREQGYDGPVTLVGAERHLPYERPPLSKQVLHDPDLHEPKPIATQKQLFEAAVVLVASTPAEAILPDRKALRLLGGAELHYDKLLLATGAFPRCLPLAEGNPHVVTLRTFEDAVAIRARLRGGVSLAIIGGGFIGLELAAAARARGAAVTIVEAQPRLLQRGVPAEIAAMVQARHEAEGVRVLCGRGIGAIEDRGGQAVVTLADGEALVADLVVVGIGAVPNVSLAEGAGLALDNGIAVDETLRTSDADIFAAGDCCSFPLALYGGRRVRLEAWRNAQEQGALAARNMLGAGERHAAVPWFWSDQYDLGLQIAGLADEGATTVRRDLGDGAMILFHLAGDGRLVAAGGLGRGNAAARDIRLAELLIAKRACPAAEQLADPDVKLKPLLSA